MYCGQSTLSHNGTHMLCINGTCLAVYGWWIWGFGKNYHSTKKSSTIPQLYPVSNNIFLSITCHGGSIYFFGFFFFLCVMEGLDKIGIFSISISHEIIMCTLLVYLSFFHNDHVVTSRQKLQRKVFTNIQIELICKKWRTPSPLINSFFFQIWQI